MLGDQTVRTRRLNQTVDHQGRRLLIGQGPVGNGVQCGVDVGMVAANIATLSNLNILPWMLSPKWEGYPQSTQYDHLHREQN